MGLFSFYFFITTMSATINQAAWSVYHLLMQKYFPMLVCMNEKCYWLGKCIEDTGYNDRTLPFLRLSSILNTYRINPYRSPGVYFL